MPFLAPFFVEPCLPWYYEYAHYFWNDFDYLRYASAGLRFFLPMMVGMIGSQTKTGPSTCVIWVMAYRSWPHCPALAGSPSWAPALTTNLQMTSVPGNIQVTSPKRLSKMPANQAVNLNHLLNFTLPPRQTRPLSSLPRRSRKAGTAQGGWNKERRWSSTLSLCAIAPTPLLLSRVCKCTVSVCHGPNRRLYCAFCRPGHVC